METGQRLAPWAQLTSMTLVFAASIALGILFYLGITVDFLVSIAGRPSEARWIAAARVVGFNSFGIMFTIGALLIPQFKNHTDEKIRKLVRLIAVVALCVFLFQAGYAAWALFLKNS